MNLFTNEGSGKQAVGGLSRLSPLKDKVSTSSGNTGDSPWGNIWKARGGFEFSLKAGEDAEIVLLDDIQVVVATPLLTGWVNHNSYSFPKLDYVRSLAYDTEGNETGETCWISEVTGMSPTLVGIAPILDTRSYTTRDNKKVPYSFRPLLIKSDQVLTQLQTTSKHYGRSLELARFNVTRSTQKKSPGVGDNWFCPGFLDLETLQKNVPDLKEGLNKVNVSAGYPIPDLDTAKQLLRIHVALCKKHADKGSKITNYNEAAFNRLMNGESDHNDSTQFDGLEDLDNAATSASTPYASNESDFDLGELDDLLDG